MNDLIGKLWPVFIIGFPFLWVYICRKISSYGWRHLADHYSVQTKPIGKTRYFCSMEAGENLKSVESGSYGSCLFLTLNEEYLFIDVLFAFKFSHPTLRIPLDDFEFHKDERFWGKMEVITLKEVPKIKIVLSKRNIKWIKAMMAEPSN